MSTEAQPTVTGPTYSDILTLAIKVDQDLEQARSKMQTIRSFLAAQPDAERVYEFACPAPHCGIAFATADRRDDHARNVHGIEA